MAEPEPATDSANPFWARSLLAPSAVYFDGTDILRVTTVGNTGSVTITLSGRTLGPANNIRPFSAQFTASSNRAALRNIERMPEGWLLGLTVSVTGGSPTSGAVWAQVDIVRGEGSAALSLQPIVSGFVSATSPLLYPGGVSAGPLDGAGNLRSITGSTPGAGAEISETVPAGARWEVLGFRAQLVTAVAVANRVGQLDLDDGANVFYRSASQDVQSASLTLHYSWGQGFMASRAPAGIEINLGLPNNIRLGPGYRLHTNTLNIQAADQWSVIQYLVREWFDV
jgi:hypothetical protein